MLAIYPAKDAPADGLRVEQADLLFRTESDLGPTDFPGPALRGWIGRALERHGGPECMEFLQSRFKPVDGAGFWRFSFHEPPLPRQRRFRARLTTLGEHAAGDMLAIIAALDVPDAFLALPGLRSRIALDLVEPRPAHSILPAEPTGAPSDLDIHLLTPLSIHQGGEPLTAAAWLSPQPLLDSIRIRFADLAGIRRSSMPPSPVGGAFSCELHDLKWPMPISGERQSLSGVIGTMHWRDAPAAAAALLATAPYLGAGRLNSFGFGTMEIRSLA